MSFDGKDLRPRTFTERRKALEAAVPSGSGLMVTVQSDDLEGAQMWLKGSGPADLEGVVAKRADEPYGPARDPG